MQKKLLDKLANECTETVEEVKLATITLAENENSYINVVLVQCTVLFWIFLQLMLVE